MLRRNAAAAACSLTLLAGLAAPAGAHAVAGSTAPSETRPNIVVVMVDDLSAELAGYMSEVGRLEKRGVTFPNYFVANSLCCPSRATYLSGKYSHNSKVRSNYWPHGGFGRFLENDLDTNAGPYLSAAGYRTGLIGKYLNEYEPAGDTDGGDAPDYPPAYVPPGWDEWFSTGFGYQEFDYTAVDSVDGETQLVPYAGGDAADYFTDVMTERAADFIERATDSADDDPFFLTLTPFATHSITGGVDPQQPDSPRFPPAPRDRADSPDRPAAWGAPEYRNGDCGRRRNGGCPAVEYPDPSWGSFNQLITDAPAHMPTEPLPQSKLDSFAQDHTERVQQAQAVNDLIRAVRDDLDAAGVADSTYIVFTSDNGFHLGEHALDGGKGTPYDHDVRVPLVVYPPGGTASRSPRSIAQNTDLLPTLLDIANADLPADLDGKSLLPIVSDAAVDAWRKTAFIEYDGFHDKPDGAFDPDGDEVGSEPTPAYVALRTSRYLYVDYGTLDERLPSAAKAEYFDLRSDPYMVHNVYRDLRHARRVALNDAAVDYDACAGSVCWDAGLTAP